ncbi:MAG: hypothetical protein WC058_06770 [Phycisphaeraceae bacterium]
MNKVLELFCKSTASQSSKDGWKKIIDKRQCLFLHRACLKNRKSNPDVLIGTCMVSHGRKNQPVIICPHRFLERRQIFLDAIHLLTLHEPGNELHIVPEIALPGGSVDYFLVSARKKKVRDFVGIELQTLDTTGTAWPERQRFLHSVGIPVKKTELESQDGFGMNWKMTAKTILVQLHHKINTFEHLNHKLVLVIQDHLLEYMKVNFDFGHMANPARQGDSMHIHAYCLDQIPTKEYHIELAQRLSTDAAGVGRSLGLQANARIELEAIHAQLEAKISSNTLFEFGPIPSDDSVSIRHD